MTRTKKTLDLTFLKIEHKDNERDKLIASIVLFPDRNIYEQMGEHIELLSEYGECGLWKTYHQNSERDSLGFPTAFNIHGEKFGYGEDHPAKGKGFLTGTVICDLNKNHNITSRGNMDAYIVDSGASFSHRDDKKGIVCEILQGSDYEEFRPMEEHTLFMTCEAKGKVKTTSRKELEAKIDREIRM